MIMTSPPAELVGSGASVELQTARGRIVEAYEGTGN